MQISEFSFPHLHEAHEQRLKEIDKASGGQTLWRR